MAKTRYKRHLMRQSNKRLLMVIVTLCTGISILEVGFYAVDGPPYTGNHHRVFCSYDALLGWRLTPNKRVVRRTSEYTHVETVDSLGMRDSPRAVANPTGVTRVLVLGDSFVEGYSVGDAETITRRLQARAALVGI